VRQQGQARFLRELAADDRFTLVPILGEDLPRVAELVETYENFPLAGIAGTHAICW
jgi:hypothetical protein